MTLRGVTAASLLLCFLLGMLSPAPADSARSNLACCTSYNKMQLPFQRIRGYREQNSNYCRIEAIIFYTIYNRQVCGNPKEKWVKHYLDLLSIKLKNMSKVNSGPEKAAMESPKNLQVSKTVETVTKTFHNSTEIV
ncbi:C-C motif chemokine 2 [Oryzias melastigma]|uniref:C-C motif chemokine 2 n=1 Tax=Oryzias melastigma TaxID=30732 RepID=A0A3B3CL15_ORYME|nr:C-C motif chemokine 2 [Oryzias melastigma]KAF6727604.1 C-C motif chemokine 2 [Oryzias melastigma]